MNLNGEDVEFGLCTIKRLLSNTQVPCRQEKLFCGARAIGELGEEEGAGLFALSGLNWGFGLGFVAAVAGAGSTYQVEGSKEEGVEGWVVRSFGELFDDLVQEQELMHDLVGIEEFLEIGIVEFCGVCNFAQGVGKSCEDDVDLIGFGFHGVSINGVGLGVKRVLRKF